MEQTVFSRSIYNDSLGVYLSKDSSVTITGDTIGIQASGNTVTFRGTTMRLSSTSDTDNSMIYINQPDAYTRYSLEYYYQKDSIFYRYVHIMGHYWSETIELSTP